MRLILASTLALTACQDRPIPLVYGTIKPGQTAAIAKVFEVFGFPGISTNLPIWWISPDCDNGTGFAGTLNCRGGYYDPNNGQIVLVWVDGAVDVRHRLVALALAHELRHWRDGGLAPCDSYADPHEDWRPGGLVERAAAAVMALPDEAMR